MADIYITPGELAEKRRKDIEALMKVKKMFEERKRSGKVTTYRVGRTVIETTQPKEAETLIKKISKVNKSS